MSARDTLRRGDVQQALAELTSEVRARPEDAKLRVFMFQLLAVLGKWDRALTQLQVLRDLDPNSNLLSLLYEPLVQCEILRSQVFEGKRAPTVFGEPEEWIALMLEALRLQASKEYGAATKLRAQACEAAPANPGEITKRGLAAEDQDITAVPFEWLADADPRFGPIIEAVINGSYYWVPLHRVRRIEFEPPGDLRDVVWMPCQFLWGNGGEAAGFIPTRYPGVELAADDRSRLSRLTEWVNETPDLQRGVGQRLLASDADDYPLMEIQRIVFHAK